MWWILNVAVCTKKINNKWTHIKDIIILSCFRLRNIFIFWIRDVLLLFSIRFMSFLGILKNDLISPQLNHRSPIIGFLVSTCPILFIRHIFLCYLFVFEFYWRKTKNSEASSPWIIFYEKHTLLRKLYFLQHITNNELVSLDEFK